MARALINKMLVTKDYITISGKIIDIDDKGKRCMDYHRTFLMEWSPVSNNLQAFKRKCIEAYYRDAQTATIATSEELREIVGNAAADKYVTYINEECRYKINDDGTGSCDCMCKL